MFLVNLGQKEAFLQSTAAGKRAGVELERKRGGKGEGEERDLNREISNRRNICVALTPPLFL